MEQHDNQFQAAHPAPMSHTRTASLSGGTVGKALSVLDQVATFEAPVRFSELLAHSPFPKATLYRLLQTLTEQGMLSFDAERQTYAVGLRLVRLAHAAWQHTALAPVARPFVDDLAADTDFTVHLAQLDGYQVVYVDKRNARKQVRMYSAAGKVGPGYCTGIGKAMLAFLPPDRQEEALAQQTYFAHTSHTLTTPDALREELTDIRRTGYALDREEHEPGIICLGVPICSSAGQVLGGLSVTSTTQVSTLESLSAQAPTLSATAQKIAEKAEIWGFPEAPKPDQ